MMTPVPDPDELIWLFESEPVYPYEADERESGHELGWRRTWPYTKLIFRTVRAGVEVEAAIEPGYESVRLRLRLSGGAADLVDLDLREVRTVGVERNGDHELLRIDFADDAPAATLWLRLKPDVMLTWSYAKP